MVMFENKKLTEILDEHLQHEYSKLGTILSIISSEQVSDQLKDEYTGLSENQIDWLKKYSQTMEEARKGDPLVAFSTVNPNGVTLNPDVLNFLDAFQIRYKRQITNVQLEPKNLREISAKQGELVYVDQLHMYSIISNPLSNAVKYAMDRIVITQEKDDESITLRIINDGNPISSDNIYLIRRGLETSGGVVSTNKREVGSGLGLYICRSLSELNNVGFDIRRYGNEDGDLFDGTQVSLRFPRNK